MSKGKEDTEQILTTQSRAHLPHPHSQTGRQAVKEATGRDCKVMANLMKKQTV
jgi:hypothetical protein